MSSSVDIANQALMMVGSKPIVSFEDNTTEANIMATAYQQTKASVLRMHEWGCSTKVETLALLEAAPTDTYWHYAYAMPKQAIRITDVFTNGIDYYNRREWQVEVQDESKVIVSRIPNAIARFTYDVPESRLDAHVEALLVARLAFDFAYALTGSNTRESNLGSIYMERLKEARTTDNLEGSHTGFRIDTLQNVRY